MDQHNKEENKEQLAVEICSGFGHCTVRTVLLAFFDLPAPLF
jgi:hypothetical protein